MFTVALFTIAKTWKQTKYPSTELRKYGKEGGVYVYMYEILLNYMKIKEILTFAMWVEIESIILTG